MGKSKRWLTAVLAAAMVVGLFQILIRADAVYHSITVGESEHGTVTVNKENSQAAWSELVTLTIDCEDNYKVDTVTYVTEEGESFTADSGSIGEWIFPMPNSNVTVNVTYKLTNIITVDFGAGHEDFVQKNFSGVEGLVVDGSLVTFVYDPEDPDYAHAANAKNQFLYGFDYEIQDPMDNGEMYMRDIALKPIEDYADMSEYQEDEFTLGDIRTDENCVTFYALWAQPVTDAVITVEPLTCGTVVTLNSRGSTAQADPAPVMTATGGLHFSDYQLFFNNWNIAGLESVGDSITVMGGTSCTATCFLEADWGYYLPEDLESAITVEGGYSFELGYWNLDNGLAIEVPSIHVEGDDAVIVPATCTEDGSKTYTCTECQEEVVEVLEATGHDWGEWEVVKPATVDEEGLEVRTCLNDPEHTESHAISKLTPEPAPSEDEPAPAGDLYNLTSGGGEYVIGSKEDYTITIKRSVDDASCYSHFTGKVKIDDNALGDGDYTSKPGSTIISIIPSTMDKLSAGEHVITVVFDDGEVSLTINVRAAQNETKTAPAPATVPATGEMATPASATVPATGEMAAPASATVPATGEMAAPASATVPATGEMAAPVTTAGIILCLSAAAVFVTTVTVRRRKHVRE